MTTRSMIVLVLLLISIAPLRASGQNLWEDWYLRSDGTDLYVTEFGRGDTVVVLHGGWGAEHSYLFDAVTDFGDGYHFVLYDQRGSLRSPSPDSLITLQQHVADLERLRETLSIEKMTIVAHSMGTFLAMAYLDAYPANVAGVVLLAAVPAKMNGLSIAPEAIAFMQRPAVQEQIEAEGLNVNRIANSKEDSKIWKIHFAAANIYHIERWSQLKGGRIFYSESANEASSRSMPESWDFIPRMQEHGYPITVILGDHDFADWTGERWTSIAEDLPNLQVVILSQAGHNAWIDQPKEFAKALSDGLQKAFALRADAR